MRNFKFALIACGLLLSAVAPASAKEMIAMGPGTSTCEKYTQLYKRFHRDMENDFFAWAQGYMSATNLTFMATGGHMRNLSASSTEAQMYSIRAYCSDHPRDYYASAVNDVLINLPFVEEK